MPFCPIRCRTLSKRLLGDQSYRLSCHVEAEQYHIFTDIKRNNNQYIMEMERLQDSDCQIKILTIQTVFVLEYKI
jgi:hypothetical protein